MPCYASVHFRHRANQAPLSEPERHYRIGDTATVDDVLPTGMQAEEFVILELPGTRAEWAFLLDSVREAVPEPPVPSALTAGEANTVSLAAAQGATREDEVAALAILEARRRLWENHDAWAAGETEGPLIRLRRYYWDLAQLPAARRAALTTRAPLLTARKQKLETQSKLAHLQNLARSGNLAYMRAAAQALFPNVDIDSITNPREVALRAMDRLRVDLADLDDDIAATAFAPIAVPAALVSDGAGGQIGTSAYLIDRGEDPLP